MNIRKLITSAVLLVSFGAVFADSQKGAFLPVHKLQYADYIIENCYVDTVNADALVETAITSMLKKLDPHSVYSNAEETRELTEPLMGEFSGIGVQFNMGTDTVYVIQPVAGGPSEKVGIRAGDRIISVNDSVIAGKKMKQSEVMKRLRGPKGSVVNLSVLRRGESEPLSFRVVRDNIPIYSVDASFMVDSITGYVRITRFSETTFDEMNKALAGLKSQGMKQLIIDLQDNSGGVLQTAVEIADMFLPENAPIVSTKGDKAGSMSFEAETPDKFNGMPVVVLVNQYSASASEILAGALQDNDRAVIVGRRTFGKGLVQRPYPMPDGSMIRLTVARYYTPSGRCIQKPYDMENNDDYYLDMMNRYKSGELTNADSIHFSPENLYHTIKLHRPVYGGGGIMPDKFVPLDTVGNAVYLRNLIARGVIYQFCLKNVEEHRREFKHRYATGLDYVNHFTVDDDFYDRFVKYAEKEGVTPEDEAQAKESEPLIRTLIKAYIGRDIYDDDTFYRIYNTTNVVFKEAMQILGDPKSMHDLMTIR